MGAYSAHAEGAVRTHNEHGGTQGVLAHREERFTLSEALALLLHARGDRRDTVARPVGAMADATHRRAVRWTDGRQRIRSAGRPLTQQKPPTPADPEPKARQITNAGAKKREPRGKEVVAKGRGTDAGERPTVSMGRRLRLRDGLSLHSGQGSSHGAHEAHGAPGPSAGAAQRRS